MIKFSPYNICSKQNAVFSIKRFLYVVLLICSSYSIFAQWQQTSGPGGGLTTALYAKGDTLFAGNFEHFTLTNPEPKAGTLFRSTDHAQRWFKDSTGFHGIPNSFTNNGSSVFVSTSTDGIFRSLNNGSTWTALSGTNALSPVKLLTVNGIVYVGRTLSGVSKSTDNGNTFINASSGLPVNNSPSVSAMGAVGNTIFIGVTTYTGADAGIYRSTNSGTSWQLSNGSLSKPFVTSFTTNGK